MTFDTIFFWLIDQDLALPNKNSLNTIKGSIVIFGSTIPNKDIYQGIS